MASPSLKVPTAAPLVSILTPTYNHEKFVGCCIESVLQQTYSNWEQIIIDDGSTDGTIDVVTRYPDQRIILATRPHRGIEGLAHTYNEALAKSKGDLIAILEGDDLWPTDKLSVMAPVFSDPAIILAYGSVKDCSVEGAVNRRPNAYTRRHQKLPTNILRNVPRGSTGLYMARADAISLIPESTVIIRRSALEQIGGFQYIPGLCVASYPTFLRLSLAGEFYHTSQVMGFRRRHSRSASIQYSSEILAGVESYAREFIRQAEVGEAEAIQIEKSWQQIRHSTQFTAGRVSLVERRWKDARAHFLQALSPRMPRIFLASLAGWMLAGVHWDLEKAMGWLGKAQLSSDPQGHSSGGAQCPSKK